MHPAKSVIFFTVTSGAGYGLFIVLAVFALSGVELAAGGAAVAVFAVGLGLVTAGLLSSTLHLANKKNAWRAFFRVRTSWLSREGLLAVAFYPPALAWGALLINSGGGGALQAAAALVTAAVALATLFSTGMIYACLRTIPQWHTPLTPVNYIALGMMSGALLALALCGDSPALRAFTVATVAAGGLCKLWYYRAIGRPGGPTIGDATGLRGGTVRLLDVGHSAGTFLTGEFGFRLPGTVSLVLRAVFFVLSIAAPAALLLGAGGGAAARWLAGVSAAAGLLVERYLFFSDARHVVNLYHGAPNTRAGR